MAICGWAPKINHKPVCSQSIQTIPSPFRSSSPQSPSSLKPSLSDLRFHARNPASEYVPRYPFLCFCLLWWVIFIFVPCNICICCIFVPTACAVCEWNDFLWGIIFWCLYMGWGIDGQAFIWCSLISSRRFPGRWWRVSCGSWGKIEGRWCTSLAAETVII